MVAAGAFAPRDTGFLRTPLLSTWKSVWTKLPARGPTVRKSYSYSRWNGVLSAIFRWVFAGGAGPLWVVLHQRACALLASYPALYAPKNPYMAKYGPYNGILLGGG